MGCQDRTIEGVEGLTDIPRNESELRARVLSAMGFYKELMDVLPKVMIYNPCSCDIHLVCIPYERIFREISEANGMEFPREHFSLEGRDRDIVDCKIDGMKLPLVFADRVQYFGRSFGLKNFQSYDLREDAKTWGLELS